MFNLSDEEKEEIYGKSVMLCAKNKDLKRFNLKRIKQLKTRCKAIAESTNNNWQANLANSSTAGKRRVMHIVAQ